MTTTARQRTPARRRPTSIENPQRLDFSVHTGGVHCDRHTLTRTEYLTMTETR